MISKQHAIVVHDILLSRFGGTEVIRDEGLLESALRRPFQTFDSQELYPEPIDKAAAIFQSVILNHPFVDGNKRISHVLMPLLLKQYNLDINSTEDEKYDFVIRVCQYSQMAES